MNPIHHNPYIPNIGKMQKKNIENAKEKGIWPFHTADMTVLIQMSKIQLLWDQEKGTTTRAPPSCA